jgi:hypothetical protein
LSSWRWVFGVLKYIHFVNSQKSKEIGLRGGLESNVGGIYDKIKWKPYDCFDGLDVVIYDDSMGELIYSYLEVSKKSL